MKHKGPGMLISDEEITERFGDVLPMLDQDRATKGYAIWGMKRYRPDVEKKMAEAQR